MKIQLLSAMFLGALLAVGGCAADTSQDNGEQQASEEELTASASKLVGAYQDAAGSVRPPTFRGLVFKSDGTFFADIDTGIRCVRAPCPSEQKISGKYTATKNYVHLNQGVGAEASSFYGRYSYSLTTKKLSLSRSDWSGWTNTMSPEISYCVETKDCDGQGIIHPMCVGHFDCASNTCGYKCGIAVTPIWSAASTKLVAQNAGGGFVRPGPAGSTCATGQSKFTLDVANSSLAWEECNWNDLGLPLHTTSGTTALSAADMKKVNAAMNAVAISKGDICGADKPYLSLKVTSPAGDKTYNDSFYSCQGGNKVYVDNIDAVFGALRDAAH